MNRVTAVVGIGVLAAATATGTVSAQTSGTAPKSASQQTAGTAPRAVPALAIASLIDGQKRPIGEARFQQTPRGVLLRLQLKNATPGVHALHIHEIGRCDAPSFESAGGHFEPAGRKHGFLNAQGQHAGDLPNVEVPSSLELSIEFLLPDVTLDPGQRSLLDANGSALVLHVGRDDHTSDPAGESGDRLACGPIVSDGVRR